MFSERQINWNDYPDGFKRGRCVVKETYVASEYGVERTRWSIEAPPIFTQDRDYILSRLPRH